MWRDSEYNNNKKKKKIVYIEFRLFVVELIMDWFGAIRYRRGRAIGD